MARCEAQIIFEDIALYTTICHNPPIFSFTGDKKKTWPTLNRTTFKHVRFLLKYRDKPFFFYRTFWQCVFITQPFSNTGISVWPFVWVTTNCRVMSYILLSLNKPANYKQSLLNTYFGHERFNLNFPFDIAVWAKKEQARGLITPCHGLYALFFLLVCLCLITWSDLQGVKETSTYYCTILNLDLFNVTNSFHNSHFGGRLDRSMIWFSQGSF